LKPGRTDQLVIYAEDAILLGENINTMNKNTVFVLFAMMYVGLSEAWVCGCSFARIVGSNPAGGMGVCLL
jgi:hypothetical protein